jgi:hypothetical protein
MDEAVSCHTPDCFNELRGQGQCRIKSKYCLARWRLWRTEIAQLHGQLEEANESLRALNIALLRHMETTAAAIRELQARFQ